MMKFKGTASLLTVFVVLGTWVYFTDVRGRDEREQAAEDAKKVFGVDDEEISRISLIYPDRTIQGARNETGWEFISPAGMEADSGEWDLLASNVPRLERDETIFSEPTDLEQYGLAPPDLRVEIAMSDGRSEEILFGNENPGGSHYYSKLGSSAEVFMSPTGFARTFRKEANDLRDKTVLRFEQGDIDRIEINGSNPRSLVREGDSWSLLTPIETAADSAEVSTFLGAVGFARARGFGEEGADTSEMGFDEPSLEVILHDSAADSNHVLLIGGQPEDEPEQYFAKDASRDTVFIVDSDIMEKAERGLFDWRDKTLASFDRDDVVSIRLEKADDSLELRKSGEDWLLPDEGRAQWTKVSAMLNALEFERATEIIDSPGPLGGYGLASPRLRVVLGGDGEDVLAFNFGADAEDAGHIYWKSEIESVVKAVSKDVFDRFDLTAEDLLDTSDPGP